MGVSARFHAIIGAWFEVVNVYDSMVGGVEVEIVDSIMIGHVVLADRVYCGFVL